MTFGLNRRRVVEATRTWTFSPLLQPTGFQPVVVEWLQEIDKYRFIWVDIGIDTLPYTQEFRRLTIDGSR